MLSPHREQTLFINGNWEVGEAPLRLPVVNPTTGAVLTEVATARPEDVLRAASAAGRAFDSWRKTSGTERARFLRGFACGLEARAAVLVELQMLNNGKPRAEAEIDLCDAVATFHYYATLAEAMDIAPQAATPLGGGAHLGRIRHEPLGPIGLIVPWNFPLVTSAWKLAPALAAGCTVVLKPSEKTPLVELAYGDIAAEIDLPPGVLNIVTGAAAVGIALTQAPELRKISFTGSNMTGAQVMEGVAARCLPVALELGGKSPILVTAGADLDLAVDCVMAGIFFNAGQVCSATSRLIVQDTMEPELIARLEARVRAMAVASPFSEACDMGPITTRDQFDKVASTLAQAQADGLTTVTGGETCDGDGFFVQPTIYREVDPAHPVWRQEIFGPVLATRRFHNESEGIALANDSAYGLAASVIAGDNAEALAAQIEAGHIWLNTPQIVYPQSAWGGFKASGIGRELGPWGLAAFQGVKHITAAI